MATTYSSQPDAGAVVPDRRAARRQQTIDEALDHAVAIMTEHGVGALTVSEMARRMGIRAPSLYKYFPSLHGVYDALFARGLRAQQRAVRAAIEESERGTTRIRIGARAVVAWTVANPALAQLMFWRPVPGFEPSPEVFHDSVTEMVEVQAELAEAVQCGELVARAADADAVRLFTIVLSGVISQQMANEPGATYDTGVFTRLTDDAIDMFFNHYTPAGADHADPGQ
jgi:AcrR family transcriptional regulator